MIPLYDAHNHLHDSRLRARLPAVLNELPELGLKQCVVNGTCEADWPRVQELARANTWIIPAFGLHPWFAKERSPSWFDSLRRFIDETPRATIGEIGLDRWMRDPDVADQEQVFRQQLEVAVERNLPATIHCLKAWGSLEKILRETKRPTRGFLLHSYGGSAEMVAPLAKLGGYFSISGYFAHDRKAAQRDVFKTVPIDRLLVETDAPDMLPPPALQRLVQSEANDPTNIEPIYRFAAQIRGVALDQFAIQVQTNFQSLFT